MTEHELRELARVGARQLVEDIAETFPELGITLAGANVETRKPHWTQTPRGKAILAKRRKPRAPRAT